LFIAVTTLVELSFAIYSLEQYTVWQTVRVIDAVRTLAKTVLFQFSSS
jgi:hypothetical protein